MFLFIIGLEMRPSRLWSMRRDIFGLGSLQVLACGLLLTGVGVVFGFPWAVSFVCGMGFVLTSTAIAMQLLGERGGIAAPRGQKIVAVLLFEDLLIVPLLALVAFLALAAGQMNGVAPDLRLFFCLPFAHSEDLADQALSVQLNARLGATERAHAEGHRDIILRFGRFPHRNPLLLRETTAAEQGFLDEGGFAG